jgi:hypothetical protein
MRKYIQGVEPLLSFSTLSAERIRLPLKASEAIIYSPQLALDPATFRRGGVAKARRRVPRLLRHVL